MRSTALGFGFHGIILYVRERLCCPQFRQSYKDFTVSNKYRKMYEFFIVTRPHDTYSLLNSLLGGSKRFFLGALLYKYKASEGGFFFGLRSTAHPFVLSRCRTLLPPNFFTPQGGRSTLWKRVGGERHLGRDRAREWTMKG